MLEISQDLFGQLFGDRGYAFGQMFEKPHERGLQLVTKTKQNMNSG